MIKKELVVKFINIRQTSDKIYWLIYETSDYLFNGYNARS